MSIGYDLTIQGKKGKCLYIIKEGECEVYKTTTLKTEEEVFLENLVNLKYNKK